MTTDKWSLPDSWAWATLADLTEIKGGVTVDKKRTVTDPVTLPYLRVANVQNGYLDLREVKEIVVNRDRAEQYLLRCGDILLNEGGDRDKLGRGWVWNGQIDPCIHQNHVFRARPALPELSSKFISYYANAFGQPFFMQKGKQSVNLASISLTAISGLPIPLAPLNEQRRIVEKIETLFARLDKGEEALHEVQKLLARYRQSVLKAAVTGELTAEWRAENIHRLEHGRDLLAHILKSRRETWEGRGKYKEPAAPKTSDLPELPEGWVWASIDQVSSLVTKGSSPNWQGFDYTNDGVLFVRSQNVGWGELRLEDRVYLPETFNEKESKSVLKEGDLLLNIVGASIGRCAIASSELRGANCNQAVAIIRLVDTQHSPYVLRYLASPAAQECIHSEKVDVARANYSLAQIRSLQIPLPPHDEQDEVARRIEYVDSQIETLQRWSKTELARSHGLRQSILKDAFSGRLVPQDPSDESAAELLARIQEVCRTSPGRARKKASA